MTTTGSHRPDSPDRRSAGALHTHGSVATGFEGVAAAFEANFTQRGELGAGFSAVVDGELVVDLWGGLADRAHNIRWRDDTLVGIFSGTKGLVATCLLLLIERGQLDLDVPVCRYWPEFAAHGKQAILVRHVVSHRAGLPGLEVPTSVDEATDSVRMADRLAAQRPIAPPGTQLVYHALTFGWLCGELVRRVDGRSIGRFLEEEIAAPLELDVWIGLPRRLEPRVAVFERDAGFMDELASSRATDKIAWSIYSNPPRFAGGQLAANSRGWRAAEVPASNGVVSPRSLARLYGCLARGGEIDGVRLLSETTIEAGRRCLSRGHDPYIDMPVAYATGFALQTGAMGLGLAADAFGHGGAGGSVHGAWPSQRTGFSYSPNLLRSRGAVDERAQALLDALHAAVTGRTS